MVEATIVRSRGTAWLVKLVNTIDKMSIRNGKVASFALVALIGVITYEVTARYIFSAPTVWGMETETYLYAIVWLFAVGWTHQADAHVKVDIFYNRLSQRGKAIMDCITSPIVMIFCVVVIWTLIGQAMYAVKVNEHSSSAWGQPVYPVKIALPVGAFLLTLQCIAEIIRDFYKAITGRELK